MTNETENLSILPVISLVLVYRLVRKSRLGIPGQDNRHRRFRAARPRINVGIAGSGWCIHRCSARLTRPASPLRGVERRRRLVDVFRSSRLDILGELVAVPPLAQVPDSFSTVSVLPQCRYFEKIHFNHGGNLRRLLRIPRSDSRAGRIDGIGRAVRFGLNSDTFRLLRRLLLE